MQAPSCSAYTVDNLPSLITRTDHSTSESGFRSIYTHVVANSDLDTSHNIFESVLPSLSATSFTHPTTSVLPSSFLRFISRSISRYRDMHSSSHTWVNPKYRENEKTRLLKTARRRFCPHSTIWTEDFDLAKHKQEWAEGKARQVAQMKSSYQNSSDKSTWRKAPPPIHSAFNSKSFSTNHSWVLSVETIFSPSWERGKLNIAPWPSKSEMKYEGDDRISTDRLHRRFLGLPRVEGNDTVSWQHRAPIAQFPFEDFYYPLPSELEIFLKTYWVEEYEFGDEEGTAILGLELMSLLDPEDQW